LNRDGGKPVHSDGFRRGMTEVDASAAHERTSVGNPDHDAFAVADIGHCDASSEGAGFMRSRVRIGRISVEDRAIGRALAVIAVPNAVLRRYACLCKAPDDRKCKAARSRKDASSTPQG